MPDISHASAIQPLAFPPKQAALIIGLSTSWLAKARMNGTGPEFRKGAKNVFYELAALQRWLAEQKTFSSTAEYTGARMSK
jgi:hypothetical protein